MRVLIIHTIYKLKGGEDSVVANEINLLKNEGIETELLQFSNEGNTFLKLAQLPFNYYSYKKTKQIISSFKPDVVHIHNLHFGGSASVIYAIKKHKVPFVITLHNYRLLCPSATLFHNGQIFTDSINSLFPWKAVFKGAYLNSKILTFWVAFSMYLHQKFGTWKNANKLIVLGEHSKNLFKSSKLNSVSNNLVVKPNFCYPTTSSAQNKESYYLYIGRLSEEKGVKVLLNAFKKSEHLIKIVGTGPMEEEVKQANQAYKNIQYLGKCEKVEIDMLLTKATALIFPSLWYETFGMVIIEAFSNSTPVITSAIGQMRNIITDKYNGFHFKVGDANNLNQIINDFENFTESERTFYGRNALKTYHDKYTPSINADLLLTIYQSVIK